MKHVVKYENLLDSLLSLSTAGRPNVSLSGGWQKDYEGNKAHMPIVMGYNSSDIIPTSTLKFNYDTLYIENDYSNNKLATSTFSTPITISNDIDNDYIWAISDDPSLMRCEVDKYGKQVKWWCNRQPKDNDQTYFLMESRGTGMYSKMDVKFVKHIKDIIVYDMSGVNKDVTWTTRHRNQRFSCIVKEMKVTFTLIGDDDLPITDLDGEISISWSIEGSDSKASIAYIDEYEGDYMSQWTLSNANVQYLKCDINDIAKVENSSSRICKVVFGVDPGTNFHPILVLTITRHYNGKIYDWSPNNIKQYTISIPLDISNPQVDNIVLYNKSTGEDLNGTLSISYPNPVEIGFRIVQKNYLGELIELERNSAGSILSAVQMIDVGQRANGLTLDSTLVYNDAYQYPSGKNYDGYIKAKMNTLITIYNFNDNYVKINGNVPFRCLGINSAFEEIMMPQVVFSLFYRHSLDEYAENPQQGCKVDVKRTNKFVEK